MTKRKFSGKVKIHEACNFQKVLLLLQITQHSLMHWSKMVAHPQKHLSLSSLVVDIQELQQHNGDSITHSLRIPMDDFT